MVHKFLLGLFPLFFLAMPLASIGDNYRDAIVAGSVDNARGNHTFNKLENYTESEFRIYYYEDFVVDEIADEAFKDNTSITTLVISDCVAHITNAVFENAPSIQNIKYTGSKENFAGLGLDQKYNDKVVEYAVDEGFINYWNKEIRSESGINICEIGKEKYQKVYNLYINLSEEDRNNVDSYEDVEGAKIKDSMKTLKTFYDEENGARQNEEWNQTGAITLIIFIAVLGMTSITVFFLLKTKNIIQ